MLRRAAVFALCAFAVSLVAARPAVAQRLSLSPTIGVYIPTTELIKAANGQELKQEVGVSVGGRLGLTLSPRVGIETTVNYVPSNLRFTSDGNETTTDANLLFGSARAAFHAIPMTQPVWLTLSGGVSMIKRSGEAYENLDDDTDVGGVVGATVGFRLGSMLSFYVAAEDYIYGRKIDETTLDADAKTQNDVQISLGLGFPVGR